MFSALITYSISASIAGLLTPAELKIDTSEFSGSIVFVSSYKKPNDPKSLRIALQLRDNVRSFLKRLPNRVIVEVENRFGVFNKSKIDKIVFMFFFKRNFRKNISKISTIKRTKEKQEGVAHKPAYLYTYDDL